MNNEWALVLQEKLENMGVEVKIKHAKYILTAGTVETNPHERLEMAMVDMIDRLRPRLLPKEPK